MGGGDLNLKKSWHTQTLANQKKIWLLEEKQREEQRKTADMLKEIQEERKKDEIKELQKAAGLIKAGPARVDWMYAAPNSKGMMNEDKEAFLLGKRRVDKLIAPTIESSSNLLKHTSTNNDANIIIGSLSRIPEARKYADMSAKIRDDPLSMIKQKEAKQLKEMLENPLLNKKYKQSKKKRKDI